MNKKIIIVIPLVFILGYASAYFIPPSDIQQSLSNLELPNIPQLEITPYVTIEEMIKNPDQYMNKTIKTTATLFYNWNPVRLKDGYSSQYFIQDDQGFSIKLIYLPDENNRNYVNDGIYNIEGILVETEIIPLLSINPITAIVLQPSLMTKQ